MLLNFLLTCCGGYQNSNSSCKGIVDIYYNKDSPNGYIYSLEVSQRGKHFVTMTPCTNCSTAMIKRDDYQNWAKEFIKIGLEPPHPRRMDVDALTCHPSEGYQYKYTGHNPVYEENT